MGERRVVDLVVDVASGLQFLAIMDDSPGVGGRIVTEAEALANYGDKGRSAYGTDPSAATMVALVRRGPAIPVIVNTGRTWFSVLPAHALPETPRVGGAA